MCRHGYEGSSVDKGVVSGLRFGVALEWWRALFYFNREDKELLSVIDHVSSTVSIYVFFTVGGPSSTRLKFKAQRRRFFGSRL